LVSTQVGARVAAGIVRLVVLLLAAANLPVP